MVSMEYIKKLEFDFARLQEEKEHAFQVLDDRVKGTAARLDGKPLDRTKSDMWQEAWSLQDKQLRLENENAQLRGILIELRIRYHVAGRRPEECYEMSMIDEVLRQQGEEQCTQTQS